MNERPHDDEAYGRFREIADQSPGVIYQYLLRPDGTHCVPFASAGMLEMFRLDPQALREDASKIFALIHPDDRAPLEASIADSKKNMTRWCVEYRIRFADGTERWVRGDSVPQRLPDGSTCWSGLLIDVTERKRTETALREAQLLIAGIVDAMPVRVFWKDLNLTYIGCNAAFARDAGFADPKDVIGKNDYQMGFSAQAELYRADDREVIESGRPKLLIEEPQTSADGPVVLLTSKTPLRDAAGRVIGVLGSYFDITERKKTEAALVKMQKLDSLGVLAGGIAHDFNNILTTILGNLSLLEDELAPSSAETRGLLTEALAACKVAAGLANQLLTFSKGGNPAIMPADVRAIIEQEARFAARGSATRVLFELGERPLVARVDADQFARVIMNLVLNATQAMPGGGEVTVRGGEVALDAAAAAPLAAGRYVRVTVADHGPGIAPDAQGKVFDPFFTTKEIGRGLGLAVCHSIMTKHGGRITAESRVGEGATFTLILPAVDAVEAPPAAARPEITRGAGRVLVMDDDAAVAKVLVRILAHLGFEAKTARDGEAALDAYMKALREGAPFDAVIMDLTISGGMGGKDAMSRLKALDSTALALVSSGYAHDPVLADPAAHGFIATLRKPYVIEEVSAAMGKVMNARSRAAGLARAE